MQDSGQCGPEKYPILYALLNIIWKGYIYIGSKSGMSDAVGKIKVTGMLTEEATPANPKNGA